jgi:hypothetical protein
MHAVLAVFDLVMIGRIVGRTLAAAIASIAVVGALAQNAAPTADEVKAAYLYRIPGYITWPDSAFASAESPLVIGVLGADKLYDELVALAAGRQIQGRNVTVRKLSSVEQDIHVLFIGNGPPDVSLSRALSAASGHPVVTVTDSDKGIEQGAMLNFLTVDGRVRFEVSLTAAERAGVKLSSRMLAVAERIVGNPQ